MDQYLLIPFLVGWTSIYQLFWCSPGVQGFDTLPYKYCNYTCILWWRYMYRYCRNWLIQGSLTRIIMRNWGKILISTGWESAHLCCGIFLLLDNPGLWISNSCLAQPPILWVSTCLCFDFPGVLALHKEDIGVTLAILKLDRKTLLTGWIDFFWRPSFYPDYQINIYIYIYTMGKHLQPPQKKNLGRHVADGGCFGSCLWPPAAAKSPRCLW